jgi:hypothetical protein
METEIEKQLQLSITAYEQLLELLHTKKELIIKGQFEQLQQLVVQEETLLKKIDEQEQPFIESIGHEKIITVIDKMENELQKENANALFNKVEKLVDKIMETNNVIKALLNDSLKFSQFMRNQLLDQSDYNYSNPMNKNRDKVQKQQGIFDTKA